MPDLSSLDSTLDLAAIRGFAIAMLIGAMVGVEREKRKLSERHLGVAGLRTFIVLAEIGAISAWITQQLGTPLVFVGSLLAVAAALVAGYVLEARTRPDFGLTTELAALTVCLLGGLVILGHAGIAVGLGIITAALLAYKQPLHGLVERLGWDDIFAGLRLLIATFVVLPLLPNRTLDPWQALNPYSLWILVILISSLSLVGYVATRWLGTGRGIALAGITGGLVSSTAVTLSFARRSGEARVDALASPLASGMLLAWGIMFARMAVEVAVVNPALLWDVLIPFSAMAIAAGLAAGVLYWRSRRDRGRSGAEVTLKNPFSLTEAIRFALFFAAILLVVRIVQSHFAGAAMYLVAALAGVTDVDAITLSMANYARSGGEPATARTAIVIAGLTNTLVKCGMAVTFGSPALRRRIVPATLAILAAGAGSLLLA